jgi:uncharacterized protein YuzE
MADNLTSQMKFEYNRRSDVLYVSLGSGEDSFRKEIDEYVVVDFAKDTGTPTGFQISHIKDAEVESVQVLLQKTLAKVTIRKKQSQVYWISLDAVLEPVA